MFASITVASVAVDRVDDVGPLYERLRPELEAGPGWRGVYVVVDRLTGKGHLLGLWDNETDARALETSGAFQRILTGYPPGLLTSPPTREVGEVVFHAAKDG